MLEALSALQHVMDIYEGRNVVIGGIAASLLGLPRYTGDIDAVILLSTRDLPELLQAAAEHGITARIQDVEAFAQRNRIVLLHHNASKIRIDISLGILPFEREMVERAQPVNLGELLIRLPTPEDLIIMKAVAHRPKDLADIQAVAENHPGMDKARIKFWVDQFGEALDNPDLWNQIAAYL